MDDKARFALRKKLKELSKYRARHTELISVYVPEGYDLQKVINQKYNWDYILRWKKLS